MTGLCQCGCGQATTINAHDDSRQGTKAGEFRKFAHGHWHRWKRQQNPEWGKKYARIKQLNDLAPAAGRVDLSHRFSTKAGYSRFVNFRSSAFPPLFRFIPAQVVVKKEDTFMDLVRKEKERKRQWIELPKEWARAVRELIEYERVVAEQMRHSRRDIRMRQRQEQEHQRLIRQADRARRAAQKLFEIPKGMVHLDNDTYVHGGAGVHSIIGSSTPSPLDELMWKEEREERELYEQASRRIIVREWKPALFPIPI